MIRIQQVKLPLDHNEIDLKKKVATMLRIRVEQIKNITIHRKSLDARKKDNIIYVYILDIEAENEDKILNNIKHSGKNNQIFHITPYSYNVEITGTKKLKNRPVIIGSGPAGIFCALSLAENGYAPIIIERGKRVEKRIKDVDKFWLDGVLNEDSNVQFGEGGAGTFSDGKLNTLIKDKTKRGKKVLEELVEAGAPKEILYNNKPHIGTDILRKVIVSLRMKIIELGGTYRFQEKVSDLGVKDKKLVRLITDKDFLDTEVAVFAIGHSARDTFKMLCNYVYMQQKPFAIGVRIEHHQKMINDAQFGEVASKLRAADYKLAFKAKNGRPVYTFCMCPGGMVTASSSEKRGIVTNGMSFHARDLENANSAVVVGIKPEDFPTRHPLAGIQFQRKYERKAFEIAGENYKAPVQLLGDFMEDRISTTYGDIYPTYRPGTQFANLKDCLPRYVVDSMIEGLNAFSRKIEGFSRKDAVLTGVETRTSSPLRIVRNDDMESSIKGLYPCGEGSGYAGGIISAAIDGLKTAEAIMAQYEPLT